MNLYFYNSFVNLPMDDLNILDILDILHVTSLAANYGIARAKCCCENAASIVKII
jgi:hypothetical protein